MTRDDNGEASLLDGLLGEMRNLVQSIKANAQPNGTMPRHVSAQWLEMAQALEADIMSRTCQHSGCLSAGMTITTLGLLCDEHAGSVVKCDDIRCLNDVYLAGQRSRFEEVLCDECLKEDAAVTR